MADGDQERARLFVVEDDERTREELARILGKHREFDVSTFARPSEALAAASHRPPEMALLDLRLPEMDGLALLERLREHSQDLMAIIMTGYGDAATPRQAREHGAVDFVEKPLDLPYLLVSLRQQAREALLRKGLRAGAELFGRMLELLPDGILVADTKGRILFANGQGRRLWEEGLRDPGTRVTHDGRVFILERTESGDRVLWHWQDLTQALEVERLAGYREMSRLLAHEVRNPLTPMRLWLQELTAMDAGDPDYANASREAQRVLLQQVDRMSALVERFRALGQDLPFAAVPVDAGKVAAELAQTMAPFAAQAGVEVVWEVPGGLVALGDDGALYHILFNLVRNAVEASAGGGRSVRVRGVAEGRILHLEVHDRGGGLPPEVAAAPFTPYLTTKEGGTGLGLLVCREMARRMGGELVLENRPGEGVTARVTLQAAQGPR
jgi:signal transduction histidine kinase